MTVILEVDADFSAEDLEHDVFGTITEPDWKKLKSYEDNEHVGDEIIPSRQRPWWYLLQVKKLIRKRDVSYGGGASFSRAN